MDHNLEHLRGRLRPRFTKGYLKMGIEKRVEKLRLRIVACEENSSKAMAIASESIEACNRFRVAVKELMEHTKSNGEAIVEHIAQLDTEKAEVVKEYRDELNQVKEGFDAAVKKLAEELDALSNKAKELDKQG